MEQGINKKNKASPVADFQSIINNFKHESNTRGVKFSRNWTKKEIEERGSSGI